MKSTKDKLKPLFFPVRKEENIEGDMKWDSGITHRIVAETPDGPRTIHYCSEDYELITNESIMIPFYEAISKNHEVDVQILSNSFSQFHVNFITQDEKVKKALKEIRKDDVFPAFRVNNSYNGRARYGFEVGLFRVVCTNGLKIPIDESFKAKTMMHTTGTLGNEKALNATMHWTEKCLEKMPKVDELFLPLKESVMEFSKGMERLEEIKKCLNGTYPSKKIESAAARLSTESNMGYPVSDYLVYNALNHALYNTPDMMEVHKKDKVDREVLEFLIDTCSANNS